MPPSTTGRPSGRLSIVAYQRSSARLAAEVVTPSVAGV